MMPLLPIPDTVSLTRRALLGYAALGVAVAEGVGARGVRTLSAPTDDVSALVNGNTAFALDLYAAMRQAADGNLLVSPYSVSQALAMTYAGAREDTAAQMAEVLSFTLSQATLPDAFATLNIDLVARGNADGDPKTGNATRTLRIANALWGDQTYPFSEAYSAEIERYYGAGLQLHDFLHAPEGVRQQINGWVAEQTNDRIQDIVPKDMITLCTRLALVNGCYFYGGWQRAFDPDNTEDGPFVLRDGAAKRVPFMVQGEMFPYARGDGFQAIEFLYADSGFAFTVILPDEGQFDAVEQRLDADMVRAAIQQLTTTDMLVYLPKFAFTFGTIDLKETLQTMGMSDAFSERADFSGMLDGPAYETEPRCSPKGVSFTKLAMSHVLHKTFVGVDERGTEAAATTVVLASPVALGMPTELIEVHIDRPFIFAIRDTETGTLLFLGRVMDPSM